MERKPQQQTLSIRISDTLRDFLEESSGLMANARTESVSVSDVANLLLESARDDRLDFRLEVAELLQAPTESLVRIRRKWERRISLARAEWILLAKYIEIACEAITENPLVPDQNSLALVLEAFLAVRGLRTEGRFGLDRYYLGNLGVPAREIIPGVLSRIQDAPLAGQGRARTSACALARRRRRRCNTASWRASPPLRAARGLNVTFLATIRMPDRCRFWLPSQARPVPNCPFHTGFLELVHLRLANIEVVHFDYRSMRGPQMEFAIGTADRTSVIPMLFTSFRNSSPKIRSRSRSR
jgi:hypothetical protein